MIGLKNMTQLMNNEIVNYVVWSHYNTPVVRYFMKNEKIESNRLAATGFGQFQPIDKGVSQLALARNRRIELKLTER